MSRKVKLAEEVERCRKEQKRCAQYIQTHEDSPERRGAELGMADYFAEELILLADEVQ
jgi:hypothetical protein